MNQTNGLSSHSVLQVFQVFLKLGLTSFGGPIAHLGYFHREIVERRQWISDAQYAQLLAICQFLPGPASSQLGFSIGLLRAGWGGAFSAFLAFTLPSAILLILFASVLPMLNSSIGQAIIHGLKLVAVAVVADAVLGMSKKLCTDTIRKSIAILTTIFLLLFAAVWLQIAVVFAGALVGWFLLSDLKSEAADFRIQVPLKRRFAMGVLAVFLVLLLGLPWLASPESSITSVANAFYRAGALVFGGGHVVLPLLQDAVVSPGWVSQSNFLAGYGAAQAIPGPMFAFSAYLGSLMASSSSSLLLAIVALIFMFLPGFLLIAGVLPLWQRLQPSARVTGMLAGVNAAVVGLLAAALYQPIFTASVTQPQDLAIALVGFAMLNVWRLSALYVVIWSVFASVMIF